MTTETQCDIARANKFLQESIRNANPAAGKWVEEKITAIRSEKDLFLAFSSAPRFTGKEKINSGESLREASTIRKGWNPSSYTVERASRILMLLSFPHSGKNDFTKTVEKLFSTADVNEQVALYAALPLLPFPGSFISRAAEGIRTNMRDVFDAVALGNPFPSDYFSEEQWNQMVLKAVFTSRPLYKIYGIDDRRNANLAAMLLDFARERWAAGRTVSPELWRCAAPFIDEKIWNEIKKIADSSDKNEREAFALLKEKKENASVWNSIGENIASVNS